MISWSLEMISPENLPSMRTVPSKISLPSNWLPLPSSAFSSGLREAVGRGATLEGAGDGVWAVAEFCTIVVSILCWRVLAQPTSRRAGLFEGRRGRQHEQHERLSGDEAGGEWDVVDAFRPRAHPLPHRLDDSADGDGHHGEAGDQHAETDRGWRRDPARDPRVAFEQRQEHPDDEREDQRLQRARRKRPEALREQLREAGPLHADG